MSEHVGTWQCALYGTPYSSSKHVQCYRVTCPLTSTHKSHLWSIYSDYDWFLSHFNIHVPFVEKHSGSWVCWLKYVIRTSMNIWIISPVITNRVGDVLRAQQAWVSWGSQGLMGLTRLRPDSRGTPTARGRQSGMSKKDKRRVRRGSREQKHTEHTNQFE